jgi:hypothetical protein
MPELAIRAMRRRDLDIAIEWAAREGWNPGLQDADVFFATDPGGFLMAFLEAEPVACISVVGYGGDFGFLGFYICRPEHRGEGFGLQIWNVGMARMAGRTVGLDGVVGRQANYARSGFVLAHRNVRYGGTAQNVAVATRGTVVEVGLDAPATLADVIVAYDRPLFPGPREEFVRSWIEPPGRRTVAVVLDRTLVGYGSIRRCRSGFKVGPLFADDEETADTVLSALAAPHAGEPVFLDVPEPNMAARRLAERHGLTPVFETARMYRGPAPTLPLDRIFGITTFELG